MYFPSAKKIGLFVTTCLLTSIGQISLAADTQLFGDDLAKALNGKSFTCVAQGQPLTLKFGTFDKTGKIDFNGVMAGRNISAGYKMNKSGKITQTNNGRARNIFRDDKGQIVIKAADLPTARCVAK